MERTTKRYHHVTFQMINCDILFKGATLLGTNFGAGTETASAKADLVTIYAGLSSRTATSIVSGLDATIINPGVWSCSLYFTLGLEATVTFDAHNRSDAVFLLITSGELSTDTRQVSKACEAVLLLNAVKAKIDH